MNSVILGNLGKIRDRFLSSGYKEQLPKAEMIRQAAALEGVKGVEPVGTWDRAAHQPLLAADREGHDHRRRCSHRRPPAEEELRRFTGAPFLGGDR